ncbi:MAG: hypothetical protein RLZZ393_89 [Pseudomonadota bacterium]|jgi:uncharacterized membrane protein YhaH (DUF805 family)
MSWFLAVLRQYATFRGRARRREYWTYLLVYFGFYILCMLADMLTGTFDLETEGGLLSGLYILGMVLPSLAVSVRRLHDTDRSGWWLLIGFVPLLGQIVLLYFLIQEGDEGANPYGPDPKAAGRG